MPLDPPILSNVPLAEHSTFGIGGNARWFARVENVAQLERLHCWAEEQRLPALVIGEGSNILFPDSGFRGLVIRNCIRRFARYGNEVEVGGGENFGAMIRRVNAAGLSGTERMFGIPGSVAGAVVGNAGAYGQEVGALVVTVTVWSPEEGLHTIEGAQADFRYRHSLFKCRRDLFVVHCRLRLAQSADNLDSISNEILERRLVKYPAGLKCPGSFFKNILVGELTQEQLSRVPCDFIQFGKIPSGRLLEAVGAKGASRGDAAFADYHGNLVLNRGSASSRDVVALTTEYAEKVRERFGIQLAPEVLVIAG